MSVGRSGKPDGFCAYQPVHARERDIQYELLTALLSIASSSCTPVCLLLHMLPYADQRFKRIVLRSSCMTDHFPAAYKAGLTDVLQQVDKRQQRDKADGVQQEQQQQEPDV